MMNRSTFLKRLAACVAFLPSLTMVSAKPSRQTLVDWLNDLREKHHIIRVQCSSDAIEYFRENASRLSGGFGFTRFEFEPTPYRLLESGDFCRPYQITTTPEGTMYSVSKEYLACETELAFAYAPDRVHCISFNRKTFAIKGVVQV